MTMSCRSTEEQKLKFGTNLEKQDHTLRGLKFGIRNKPWVRPEQDSSGLKEERKGSEEKVTQKDAGNGKSKKGRIRK